jgi:hypothetical protein
MHADLLRFFKIYPYINHSLELFSRDPTLLRNAATVFCCYEFSTAVVKKIVNQTKYITVMLTLCK